MVVMQQAATVKRAMAAANENAHRDLRRKRIGLLLLGLLFFSAWRLARPGQAINSDPATAQLVPRRTVAYSADLHSIADRTNASTLRLPGRGQRRAGAAAARDLAAADGVRNDSLVPFR